jgi:transposase
MIRLLHLIKQGEGSMNEITILGIDLAKNTFQLIGVDKHHKVVMKRRCQREKLVEIVTSLPPCTILMESCGTSNYWGRRFQKIGHTVKLIGSIAESVGK